MDEVNFPRFLPKAVEQWDRPYRGPYGSRAIRLSAVGILDATIQNDLRPYGSLGRRAGATVLSGFFKGIKRAVNTFLLFFGGDQNASDGEAGDESCVYESIARRRQGNRVEGEGRCTTPHLPDARDPHSHGVFPLPQHSDPADG